MMDYSAGRISNDFTKKHGGKMSKEDVVDQEPEVRRVKKKKSKKNKHKHKSPSHSYMHSEIPVAAAALLTAPNRHDSYPVPVEQKIQNNYYSGSNSASDDERLNYTTAAAGSSCSENIQKINYYGSTKSSDDISDFEKNQGNENFGSDCDVTYGNNYESDCDDVKIKPEPNNYESNSDDRSGSEDRMTDGNFGKIMQSSSYIDNDDVGRRCLNNNNSHSRRHKKKKRRRSKEDGHQQDSTASRPDIYSSHSSYSTDSDYFRPEPAEEESARIIKKHKHSSSSAEPVYSSQAQKMMMSMGFEEGHGLGRNKQGRVDPIKESSQRGRHGLGHSFAGAKIKYDPDKEICEVEEKVAWLESGNDMNEDIDLDRWMVLEEQKLSYEDETNFCDPIILKNILECKTVFDQMSPGEKCKARNRSNPFEQIKGCMYQNRAAIKMANMDAVFDHMFTNPINMNGKPMVKEDELLYFADVCAGPGGFSEFILSKKKWRAKGFGFTLKGDNDFQLHNFFAGPPETFEPFYGVFDDGNIYRPENIISFAQFVKERTIETLGVHFMMADGGFSVEGKENYQEILSKRLYLCQCLTAVTIVRPQGHFVCKFFDIFTRFSAGVIYLMYLCFERISIHKPNSSRPANSERYLICKWRKADVNCVRDYMFRINNRFESTAPTDDVLEIVPLELLKSDVEFYNYLVNSNNRIGEQQINNLAKFCEYLADETLIESRQTEMKELCMKYWGITSDIRSEPYKDSPASLCAKLLNNDTGFLRKEPRRIDQSNVKDLFPIYDWHVLLSGSLALSPPKFYLGLGGRRVYEYSGDKWVLTDSESMPLELSFGTLLLGEIVLEYTGKRQSQSHIKALHIIDAHSLGGENISAEHYTKRVRTCKLYCKAMLKATVTHASPLRMKSVFELKDIHSAADRLAQVQMKNNKTEMVYSLNESKYFVPKGLIFIKATELPYQRWMSQSNNLAYYAAKDRESKFDKDRPPEAVANFKSSCQTCVIWHSTDDTYLENGVPIFEQSFVTHLSKFVDHNRLSKCVLPV